MPSPLPQSGGAPRAPLMRRESSQQSHNSKSPGSTDQQPLRHPVKPAKRHLGLPRNSSSARNLQKLRGIQAGEEARRAVRQRPHDGADTEFRLPSSLDESRPVVRRNLTAAHLPRNTSHSKLKKNLSHGHLTRLGSGKNLAALNNIKAPPSPGLPGRKKRPRSADFGKVEKDLHEQEVELAQKQRERKEEVGKRVGFAVGSSGDDDEDDEIPHMEGSGLQEDEWTDQSASASPFSTRQNTANNSRRTSVIVDKPPDRSELQQEGEEQHAAREEPRRTTIHFEEAPPPSRNKDYDEGSESEEGSEPPSPRSMPHVHKRSEGEEKTTPQLPPIQAFQKMPVNQVRDAQPSLATHRILSRNLQNPAPALVSNVSAMDVSHSTRASPAPSMRSSKSNMGESSTEQEDELVSRFIPSASHPSTGSGGNTTTNTPKSGSYHTPEHDSTLAAQNRDKRSQFQLGPVSPGSTVSGSSGATTPAMHTRSRTELRMLNEKALAEREDAAKLNPIVPPHVFDRRNESLKSWLNLKGLGADGGRGGFNLAGAGGIMMGPELFQGRFKAVNTELKVVQRFRDPIGDSIGRLQACRPQHFAELRARRPAPPQAPGIPKVTISQSAGQLSKQQREPSKRSTSTSPPKSAGSPAKPAIVGSKSAVQLKRGGSARGRVTFSSTPSEVHEVERVEESGLGASADAVAREMWEAIG